MTKCSCEISLAGKVECECIIDQGLISSYQQRFGTLETLCADVLVRRLTYGGLECSREMEPAQARNRCQVIDRKFALVVDEGKLTRRRCASFDETREGSVMHHKLAHGAWVFVVDGQKALFLINGGDERFPNLRRLAVEEHKDPPSRCEGPGRASAKPCAPVACELPLSGRKLDEATPGHRQGRMAYRAISIHASASSSPTCRGLPKMSSPSTTSAGCASSRSRRDTPIFIQVGVRVHRSRPSARRCRGTRDSKS